MTPEIPLVSIGLPLYNAGEDARSVLENLLGLDYPNIELVVSDNASTDQTWDICQEYAAADGRVRVSRNEVNRGYMYNFDRVFEMATGTYFMWAAHDDRWDPQFINQCLDQMGRHPRSIFCYTDQTFRYVDTDEVKEVHYENLRLNNGSTPVRLRNLLAYRPRPHAIFYGVFRRESIQTAIPLAPIPSADISFLIRVILTGSAVHVPKILYHRAVTPSVPFRKRMEMLRPGETIPPNLVILFQTWRTLLGYVSYAAASRVEKVRMSLTISRYVVVDYGIYGLPLFVGKLLKGMKNRLRQ